MAPQDFNLIFYRKCLSQHNWAWRESKDPFDLYKHSANEDFLRSVANTNGKDYLKAFNDAKNNFPSTTANTKPKHNTPMIQLTINIPEADKLADAINNLAEALKARPASVQPQAVTAEGEVITAAPAPAEPEAPAKKRGRPAKVEAPAAPVAAAPAPEPVVEAPAPAAPAVEPESASAEQVLTGAELAAKATEYFSGNDSLRTEMRSRLVQFRNEGLGWNRPIKDLDDPAMCYQFNEKLEELKAELDQKEAAAKAGEI